MKHTLVLEYNNITQLEEAFALHGKELACLVIEPIAGNMNFVRASQAFASRCRELCTQYGAMLVFDEVMSGFRVALGSAQAPKEKAAKAATASFKQYREKDGKFYFKLADAQGQVLLQSTGFDAPRDAGQAIARLQQAPAEALAELAARLEPLAADAQGRVVAALAAPAEADQ